MKTQLQNKEFIKLCKFETTMQRKEKQEEMYMYLHCIHVFVTMESWLLVKIVMANFNKSYG